MEFQINEKSSYVSEIKAEPCFLTQGGGLAPFLLFLFPGTSGNIRLFDIDVRLTWCLNAAKRDRAAQFPFQRLTLVPPLETTLALIRPHREWVQNIKYKKKTEHFLYSFLFTSSLWSCSHFGLRPLAAEGKECATPNSGLYFLPLQLFFVQLYCLTWTKTTRSNAFSQLTTLLGTTEAGTVAEQKPYNYTGRAWLQFHSNLIVEIYNHFTPSHTFPWAVCSCLCTILYIMPAQMFVQMGREWDHRIDLVGKK